jgi:hypothetical protein
MLNPWWRIGVLLAWTTLAFLAGAHTAHKFDEAAKAEALQEQIDAANLAQGRIAEQAKSAEADLATVRQKYATLNQQWSKIRVESPANCKLPDRIVGLLKDATSSLPELPR